jgi:hypothetical protein
MNYKFITVFFIIFYCFLGMAQQDVGLISSTNNLVLFYQYPNEVFIGNNVGIKDFSIRSNNIEIVKNDAVKNAYVLYPKSLSESSLYFIDNKTKDTFDVKIVTIIDLPPAQIYWGSYSDGDLITNRYNRKLIAQYDETVILTKVKFNVEKWGVSISGNEQTFVGNGNTLSEEVLEIIKNSPAGTEIKISCVYSGTGVSNKLASSSFKLN